METLGLETCELSLYDTIDDILPEELFGFVEKHVNSNVSLNTPAKSPPRDYEVGDAFADSVNLDEFFASVFERTVSDADKQSSDGRFEDEVMDGNPERLQLHCEIANVTIPIVCDVKQPKARGRKESMKTAKRGSKSGNAITRNTELAENEAELKSCQSETLLSENACMEVDVVPAAQQKYVLSFGQEMDEYIRTQLMPYCTHENHLPVSSNGETVAWTSAEKDFLVSVTELDFDSALAENKTKEDLQIISNKPALQAPMHVFVDNATTKKVEVDLKSDIKLTRMTPVVLLERLSIQHVISTAQQMKPTPFSSSKALNRISNSTGGRVTKTRGRPKKSLENNPTNIPTASMSSTPVSTVPGPRKRGRPRKTPVTTPLTKDAMNDISNKNAKQIVAASTRCTSRPRRASIGAVYHFSDDDMSDDCNDDDNGDCVVIGSAGSSRNASARLRKKRRHLCDST